ncbi:MAG: O-antigen ligase family protein [Patescibacteria group bacterium]|nr:O-antigen ligase family protein [Patescibacteria group bacterium]
MDRLVLVIILVGLVAGQLLRVPVLNFTVPLLDVAMVVACGLLLFRSTPTLWRSVPFRWFLVFVGALLLSLLLNLRGLEVGDVIVAGAYWARLVLYGLVAFLWWQQINWHNRGFFLSALGIAFASFVAISFIQFGLFPDFEIFEYLGWDPHRFRLVGTFFDPNFSAVFLVFGTALTFLVLMQKQSQPWSWLIALGINLGALVLTVSRTGLIALGAAAVGLVVVVRNRWAWALLGLLMMGGLLIPSIQTRLLDALSGDSFQFRLQSWQEGWHLVQTHPWLGVGYNTLPIVRESTIFSEEVLGGHAMSGFDSSLLTIAATSGFLGLAAFIIFVIVLLFVAVPKVRNHHNLFSRWFVINTGVLVVASVFINAWLYPPLLTLWLVTASLSLAETSQ